MSNEGRLTEEFVLALLIMDIDEPASKARQ